jgi:hypothetical protein
MALGNLMVRENNVNEINLKIDNIDFWSPHEGNKGGMRIYWSSDIIGLGTLDIIKQEGTEGDDFENPKEEMLLNVMTEYMDVQEDKAFTEKLLSLLAEQLQVID